MRNDDLANRFVLHHLSHPEIWEAYERAILSRIAEGRERGGVKEVTETIRWSSILSLSNSHDVFYARLFAVAHPEHKGFFEYKPSAADYVNYDPLLDLVSVREPKAREMIAEEALGWEDPQLTLELEEVI